jgi:hypothetical protein
MSTTHISREQLIQFRNRALAPQEMVAVDGHLGECQSCREQLAGLGSVPAASIAAVRQARFDHITYEQMDAWVEDQLDQTERELVLSHIGLCAPCARQLKAYEQYAPAMAAPVSLITTPAAIQAAQPMTLADKLRAMFRMPQIALVGAAIAAVLILSPLMMNKSAQSPSLTSLDRVINERPAALNGLERNTDQSLVYPVSEVVEERQPILRWKSFGTTYTVAVFDTYGNRIARGMVSEDTHWLVPVALERGGEYRWQIQGDGETRTATFRVLTEADEKKLSEARGTNPGPKALGAVEQQLGLLSLAQQQFEALKRQQPDSEDAAKLLDHVNELRGR